MYMKWKGGVSKALTLSYDDGAHDIPLVEIIDRYGIKATFNLTSGWLLDTAEGRTNGRLTWDEAKNLYLKSGHEIACHTVNHAWLPRIRPEELFFEVLENRKRLEKEFGVVVKGHAYPNGKYSDEVIDNLKRCGIVYARTTQDTHTFDLPEDFLKWHPTCRHLYKDLLPLAQRFVDEPPRSLSENRLFYLWGHGYEFDREQNWDLLEEFCKIVGNRDDIWYCTNIELYEYKKAYDNLWYSADCSVVYNPSAIDVWFRQNKETYCVKGGETIYVK